MQKKTQKATKISLAKEILSQLNSAPTIPNIKTNDSIVVSSSVKKNTDLEIKIANNEIGDPSYKSQDIVILQSLDEKVTAALKNAVSLVESLQLIRAVPIA